MNLKSESLEQLKAEIAFNPELGLKAIEEITSVIKQSLEIQTKRERQERSDLEIALTASVEMLPKKVGKRVSGFYYLVGRGLIKCKSVNFEHSLRKLMQKTDNTEFAEKKSIYEEGGEMIMTGPWQGVYKKEPELKTYKLDQLPK